MTSFSYVTLTTSAAETASTGSPLKIKDQEIRFLLAPVLKTAEFLELSENQWQLTFFKNTKFTQTFRLNFSGFEPENPCSDIAKSRLCFIETGYDNGHDHQPSQEKACLYVFGRKKLFYTPTIRTAHAIFADPRGIVFTTSYTKKFEQFEQFKRVVILFCLAHAYTGVIQAQREALALTAARVSNTANQDSSELREVNKNISLFNAQFYFRMPVDAKSADLCDIWQQIRESFELDSHIQELSEQSAAIHNVFYIEESEQRVERLENEKKEQQRAAKHAQKVEKRLRCITLILAFLGVISAAADLVQLLLSWDDFIRFFS